MASSYRGLYVIYTNGQPTDVQVQDTGGNSLPLPLEDYLAREVRPDWRELPSQDDFCQARSGQ